MLLHSGADVPGALHPVREDAEVSRADGDLLSVIIGSHRHVSLQNEADLGSLSRQAPVVGAKVFE